MLKIELFVEDAQAVVKPVILKGLAKRINMIGLQPVPGDQFSFDDLTEEDKNNIMKMKKASPQRLVVTSREFRFENTHFAIHIGLRAEYLN